MQSLGAVVRLCVALLADGCDFGEPKGDRSAWVVVDGALQPHQSRKEVTLHITPGAAKEG